MAMTAKDHMRQKLDELMGTGWDGVKNSLHYSDPKVCRCFLLGLCPHDALAGTKMAMGSCSKIHNYALKADFENSSRMYRPGQHRFYELTVLTYLQKVIRSCEILDRAKKGRLTRCQTTARSNRHGDKEATLKSYGDMVDKKLTEAEELGNKGKVQEALAVIKEVERLKRRRNRLERMLDRKSNEPVKEQKQNICEECQLCIGLDDNEQRIANHSSGRLHNAILAMRRKIAELAASLEKSQVPGDWSRLEAAQQQSKQSTSRLDLASTRAHSYSPRSSRSSSRSSRSRSRSRRRSYSSDSRSSSRSSGECSSTSRSRSRSRSRSASRHRSRRSRSESHGRSRSRSPRRSRSGSSYSRSCSRSCSRSYSRSCSGSRSCSCSSQYTDRSQGHAKHRSVSRSRSRSHSRHSRGHSQQSGDRERRSRSARSSEASKQAPNDAEVKEELEPTQASEGEPEQPATKDDSKWSRLLEMEAEGTPTRKDGSPTPGIKGIESTEHAFATTDDSGTETSKPLSPAPNSSKADCLSALEVCGGTFKGGHNEIDAVDANSDVVDKPNSPAQDPAFENLNLRPGDAECAPEGEIRAKKNKSSSSPEGMHAPVIKETISGRTNDPQPSQHKARKGKARVVTAVKDWKTIKKPVINIASLRFFRLHQESKKTSQKEQVDKNLAAGRAATQVPDSKAPADADSTSKMVANEASENDTTDSSVPVQTEESENVGTDAKQQPLGSTTDKEGCTTESSDYDKSCQQCAKQEHSGSNSPSINHEESENFMTRKPHRGVPMRKKRASPQRESTQTEDSGDESCCTESSTYYQIVKKPKKKPAKNRKRSLHKKMKLEAARMSRKADTRKSSRRRVESTTEEEEDSESCTSSDSPPAKRTRTKKKRTRQSPAAKRDGSSKRSARSATTRKPSKKKGTTASKKGRKGSAGARSSARTRSKRKSPSDTSSSTSSTSVSEERRTRRKVKPVKKTKKVKRKKCK
ncbi:dentin sialophosphoprotein-like isoform X1 [Dermacentor albipictus]|uniref:dentin sialophosphoprotein-like isoform X1 n=2 Tax=Dermacentor albipictus TaxID=60249 RepID=UPI0038FCA922